MDENYCTKVIIERRSRKKEGWLSRFKLDGYSHKHLCKGLKYTERAEQASDRFK